MANVRLLTETEIRRLIRLDRDSIAAIGRAFVRLSTGDVEMPPILSLHVPRHRGEVDVKTAFIPDVPRIAIKISPGFFDNPALGLPSLNGLMVVLDARTGLLSALLLDNGYLTDIRTAAAGAVAADALARPDARIAAVIGAGMQACMQMAALRVVRPIAEVRVWARRAEAADSLAARLRRDLGVAATAVPEPRQAVHRADVIVTATPSGAPLLEWEWLCAGQHVTAMGSDAPYKNELAPAIVAKADLYVPDRQAQCALNGELRAAIAAGLVPPGRKFDELGDVLRGVAPGRTDPSQITVCDLTGTGIQDTAIANLTVERAETADVGRSIETGGAT
jgi:ornithine cyclodeaminase